MIVFLLLLMKKLKTFQSAFAAKTIERFVYILTLSTGIGNSFFIFSTKKREICCTNKSGTDERYIRI